MSFTLSEVAGLQTSKYFNVAGVAILIFDYAITLEDEARWVWGRKWDVTRSIFTISRYLPFVGTGMTAYVALRTNSDPCGPSLAENIIHILGIIAAEVLLILRTYAYWQADKRVLYGLLVYGGATIIGAVAINVTSAQLLPGKTLPVQVLPGCTLVGSRNATLVYLLLLLFEMVVLFVTAYRRFHSYREVKTSIVLTTYRDGMFYILCIILITFANVLVDGISPNRFGDLLDIPQIALHSVLASRIMFNLRKSACPQQGMTTDSGMLSDLIYSPPPLSSQSTSGYKSSGSLAGVTGIYVDIDVEMETRSSTSTSKV